MSEIQKPIWKHRDFMLLWGGQFISYIGTQISTISFPLIILALTGSPAQAGIIAGIRGLVYMLWAIPAGALIDRWDRKKVMIIGNLGSGLTLLIIAMGALSKTISLPLLYFLCVVEGTFFVFANLARYTSFIRVVPRNKFAPATAQWAASSNLALLIGPPLGGFLYQTVGAFVTFLIDAVSYFLNVLLIFLIRTPLQVPNQQRKKIHHEIQEGIQWLWNQPLLRFMNFSIAGRNILESGLYLLIILLAKQLHASSLVIGMLFACGAIGGIVGSIIAAKLHGRFTLRQLLVTATLLNFIIFVLYLFAGNILLLGLITITIYAVSPLFDVTASAYIAESVPDDIKGRVSSLSRLLELGATSAGFFITGILLEWLGSNWTISVLSFVLFAIFIMTVQNKSLAKN